MTVVSTDSCRAPSLIIFVSYPPDRMTNKEIASALRETGDLIELTGGNPYRANAFGRAARTIRGLDHSVTDLLASNDLTSVDGIGDGLSQQIEELTQRGSFDLRDELLSAVPTGLLDVLRVKGLGTKKVRALWQELGITSLDELDDAARDDRVRSLSGFGKKTQENIIENVALLRAYSQRRRYADALRTAREVHDILSGTGKFDRIVFTGDLRRKLETVSSIDMLVSTGDGADHVTQVLLEADDSAPFDPDEVTVQSSSDRADAVVESPLTNGLTLRLFVCTPDAFGSTLWRTTGSEDHVQAFLEDQGVLNPSAEEADVFEVAGTPVIQPELREGQGEWEAARDGRLPDLITLGNLRGTVHNHSTYSDGSHSLRQMAEKARSMGLSYFGICDHSQSLQVASGMKPDEVRRQQSEIASLNESFASDEGSDFRIFSGVESDILADGSLDYKDDILASFDFIVASVHSGFSMTIEEATRRIITAVENPYTTILGHPTGRLLLVREGYEIDHERVIDACAEHNVAIELNANPYRLDIDWRFIRSATDRGVLISINPDAHAMAELENVRWGVEVARKGWLTAEHCLNAKTLDQFEAWLQSRRPA